MYIYIVYTHFIFRLNIVISKESSSKYVDSFIFIFHKRPQKKIEFFFEIFAIFE